MFKIGAGFLPWRNVIETNSEIGTLLPTTPISKGINRINALKYINL